ncbi:hypothetical protein SESBI_08091 [Sesbania bispinosa]|nr:hypothetical protein SESBI_08091 [Sesbania bispinosa]
MLLPIYVFLTGNSYLQFMAWDLWGSSCYQVAYDDDFSEHSEWQCDYFGCVRDEIEEDALNEESCVQVLRILISKADTEIEELEKDLLSLQNELAWAEHEKWPEICCSALTERINWLDVAVSTLKNDHANDTEMQLLLRGKPAETLHEIVKALQREQRDHCQETRGQHLDVNILNPIVNITENAPDKDFSNIDSKNFIKEEGKELSGTSDNSTSSELVLEFHEKESDDPEKIEDLLAKPLVNRPDLRDVICAPDHSDGMKLSETLDTEVTGNEEVRKGQVITTDTGQILNLSTSKGNENIPSEAKNENTIVEDKEVSSDDFRFATGIKGRKNYLHSGLRGNGNNSLQAMNIENATLIHAENSALISLPVMQNKCVLYSGLQLTDEEKPQAQDPKSKIAANFSKSNFPSKLKAQGKLTPELEACSARESLDSPMEDIQSTSIIVSTKRQRKSKTCTDGSILNESMNTKITKGAVQPGQHETEGHAIVLYDSKFSDLQKKRRISKLPVTVEVQNSTVNLDIPNSDGVLMDNGNQVDLHISKSYSVDSHKETSAVLPSNLKDLKLSALREMAKKHNVSKYYKLPKGALLEQLVERLSSC